MLVWRLLLARAERYHIGREGGSWGVGPCRLAFGKRSLFVEGRGMGLW